MDWTVKSKHNDLIQELCLFTSKTGTLLNRNIIEMDTMPKSDIAQMTENVTDGKVVSSSPVDQAVLDEFVEAIGETGKKSLFGLIDIYLRNSPNILGKMDEAARDGDLQLLRQMGHSLKSSSASLGAGHLYELCRDLELNARKDVESCGEMENLPRYRQDVVDIQTEFSRVRLALNKIREEIFQ
jgi:HPt (histidine-containing phosphotransfer) domain-containing protein